MTGRNDLTSAVRKTKARSVYWLSFILFVLSIRLAAAAADIANSGAIELTTGTPVSIVTQPYTLYLSNGLTATFSVTVKGTAPFSFQWLENGMPLSNGQNLSSATNNTLTISNISVSNAAIYSVVVTNSFGAVTSSPVGLYLDVPAAKPPVVSILIPLANEQFFTNVVDIFGTASSSIGVASVWYQVNGGGWTMATGSNNWATWSANVTLAPYTNLIQVCAVDASGGLSAIKSARVTYLQYATIMEGTNGFGTFTPDNDGLLLQCGKAYKVTAKPLPGNQFVSWALSTNGVTFSNSAGATLNFVMQQGLQLTANFSTNPVPFEVNLAVSATNLVEKGTFTAQATVLNTTASRINGVFVGGVQIQLDTNGTGYAVPVNFISPVITSIAAGKSAVFVQHFKATSAGIIRFYCVINSLSGSTGTNYSPYITIYPSKLGVQTETDSFGNGRVASGNITLPVSLYDGETGSSLSGFALGLALDTGRQGQAVLAAVDQRGRYPTHFFILQGASEPTEFRKGDGKDVIVAGGSEDAKWQAASPAANTPVGLPVNQACGGTGTVSMQVLAPFKTAALPPLAPPPAPTVSSKDTLYQAFLNAAENAIRGAKTTASQCNPAALDVSRSTLTCSEALQKDANILTVSSYVKETILGMAVKYPITKAYPATTGPLVLVGLASYMLPFINSYHDTSLCQGQPDNTLLLESAVLPLSPDCELSPFFWHSLAPGPQPADPGDFIQAAVQVTDPSGNPISGGYIDMISTNHLGTGIQAVIDDNGTANLPVPINDDYTMCVRAPGYTSQTETVTVSSNNIVLPVVMPHQTVASAMLTSPLGQPTGFLHEGTQVTLTPHFYDTNGNEISCSGTPIFYVHNPVGASVASVDPNTGVVTILGGCGAATVYAWCNGVESAPKLISSDCNGTEPPVAATTFQLNPTALTFVAQEGGGNPGTQTVYLVNLSNGVLDYTTTENRSWITCNPSGNDITVGVNISGLGAGTYGGGISVVDTNAPKNHAEIGVTLVIRGSTNQSGGGGGGGGALTGTWVGNWTEYGPFDEVTQSTLTWHLTQSGNSVTGTQSKDVTSDVDDLGDLGDEGVYTDTLVDGAYSNGTLTIYTSGGTEFTATVSNNGNTLSGNGGTSLLSGPFTLQRQ